MLIIVFLFRMVRDYKRTTNRGSWSEESMREAVKAVLDGKRVDIMLTMWKMVS